MNFTLPNTWHKELEQEFTKDYFLRLSSFLVQEYASQTIYPPKEQVFNCLEACAYDAVKVVILGQDPYHGIGQANGLSFSVNQGVTLPPSLKNIYKALENDLGVAPSKNGDLSKWAHQGVLMLNATLTVRANTAASHQNQGWEQFTNAIIRHLSKTKQQLVFMLWGSFAQQKSVLIDSNKHLILKSVHPSPLSAYRGFLTCKHFSAANTYLIENSLTAINWNLDK